MPGVLANSRLGNSSGGVAGADGPGGRPDGRIGTSVNPVAGGVVG